MGKITLFGKEWIIKTVDTSKGDLPLLSTSHFNRGVCLETGIILVDVNKEADREAGPDPLEAAAVTALHELLHAMYTSTICKAEYISSEEGHVQILSRGLYQLLSQLHKLPPELGIQEIVRNGLKVPKKGISRRRAKRRSALQGERQEGTET